jgi:hypothetical protein
MLIQWPRETGATTNLRIAGPKQLQAQSFTRRSEPAPRHEQYLDPDQPLSRLAAETFDAGHADHAVGTLLVLAAVAAGNEDEDVVLRLPSPFGERCPRRPVLPWRFGSLLSRKTVIRRQS